MAAIRRERTAEYKAQAQKIRDRVTKEVDDRPEFKALKFFRTGKLTDDADEKPRKVRLSRDWIVQEFGRDALDLLPRTVPPLHTDKGGVTGGDVADALGYRTGEALVRDLMGVGKAQAELRENGDKRSVRNAMIEDRVREEMAERYGDPLADGSIEEEALAAVHNEKQGELMALENRQLAKRTNKQPTAFNVVKEWAARRIAQGKVAEVASRSAMNRYARAVAKASKGFQDALVAGNVEEAFQQSEIRLMNHALLVEAKKAADRLDKIVPRLAKIGKDRARKSIDQGYFDRARALVAQYEFSAMTSKAIAELEGFEKWVAEQAKLGRNVVVPPRLAGKVGTTHFSKATVEELLALDETVGQLLHFGRTMQKLKDGKEQRDFDQIVAEAVGTMAALPQRKKQRKTQPSWIDKLRSSVSEFDAGLLKMEQLFDWLDDGDPNGVFNRIVFQPLAEAQSKAQRMQEDYLRRIQKIMRSVPKETLKRWNEQIDVPELRDVDGEAFPFTRQDLIAIALNIGNEGNLAKLIGGYHWNEAAVMRVLERELTAPEWQMVQDIWTEINTLWPAIEALEKRVNGFAPEKVEPRAFRVNTPDGPIDMAGGYYPVVYDPTRSPVTEALQAKDAAALFAGGYTFASTPKGFTVERTGVERPILFSLTVINRHVIEVIHDVTHREAIMQAHKVLTDQRVSKAMDGAIGEEARKVLVPWLSHIANEWAGERTAATAMERLAKKMRTHTTIVGMGFRLSTILAQTAGYAGAMEMIGGKWLAMGSKAVAVDPIGAFDFVMERSHEVAARMQTMERDMQANVRQLQGRTGVLANARRFAFHGIGYMDRAVVIPTWLGAYNKAQTEGMTDDQAVHYADKVVRLTQGAGAAKDLSAVQRGNEWMRLATMFYSYAAAFYNRQRALGRDARRAWMEKDASAVPALIARAWWLGIVSPIVGQLPAVLLNGAGPEEDEEETWFGWGASVIGTNMFYGIPIARDVSSSFASGFDYQFTPATRAVSTVMATAKDAYRSLDGDEETEASKRAAKNATESVGYLFGLPLGQLSNAVQFLIDWSNEKTDPDSVVDWLKGLQRGKLEDE
jgi:hypothetical protein